MAAVSVVSLGVTVIASQRALADASDVVIRGEGDLLLGALVSDLAEESSPMSAAALSRALDAHAAEGLRYVAVVDRGGNPIAEAGRAEIAAVMQKPGEARIEGRRARVTGLLTPPRRGLRPAPVPGGPPPFSSRADRPPGAALLVVELEPPVIETLRRESHAYRRGRGRRRGRAPRVRDRVVA